MDAAGRLYILRKHAPKPRVLLVVQAHALFPWHPIYPFLAVRVPLSFVNDRRVLYPSSAVFVTPIHYPLTPHFHHHFSLFDFFVHILPRRHRHRRHPHMCGYNGHPAESTAAGSSDVSSACGYTIIACIASHLRPSALRCEYRVKCWSGV